MWLKDNDQAIRAFAATMLGISGDQSYSPLLAKLLVRKEQNADDLIYDRGRAALALGLLQAKEYGKDLVTMLSSANEYDRFWCNFSIEGRLSLFQLLLMRQALLPIPAGSWPSGW